LRDEADTEHPVKTFRCPVCGKEEKALAVQMRHKCRGKWRDLEEVDEEEGNQ